MVSGCVSFFLVSLAACFIAFIDPAIDRRIIYNDFRSNPYLHFDAGLVPRALGVQLGEFYYLICLFTASTCHASIVHSILLLLLIDYCIDIIILDCDHSLGYRVFLINIS